MSIGDNVTAALNTTITIRCPVRGVPTPSVSWKKNGVKVVEGEKISIGAESTLIIKEADQKDSAKYTCSVLNSFGKDDISSTVSIIGECQDHGGHSYAVCVDLVNGLRDRLESD